MKYFARKPVVVDCIDFIRYEIRIIFLFNTSRRCIQPCYIVFAATRLMDFFFSIPQSWLEEKRAVVTLEFIADSFFFFCVWRIYLRRITFS